MSCKHLGDICSTLSVVNYKSLTLTILYTVKKYLHIIKAVINFCSYIYYTVDPSHTPLNHP